MKELLRSDLRFHKTDCGRFGAMTAWGLKDTSSRPAKDLGGTLRRTLRTTLRSYDSRASGDLFCPQRQGCVANVAYLQIDFTVIPVPVFSRWQAERFKIRYHALAVSAASVFM